MGLLLRSIINSLYKILKLSAGITGSELFVMRCRWDIERIVAYDKSFEDGVACDLAVRDKLDSMFKVIK